MQTLFFMCFPRNSYRKIDFPAKLAHDLVTSFLNSNGRSVASSRTSINSGESALMDLKKSVLILVTLASMMTACASNPEGKKQVCKIEDLPSPKDLRESHKFAGFFSQMAEAGVTREEVISYIEWVKFVERNPVYADQPLDVHADVHAETHVDLTESEALA